MNLIQSNTNIIIAIIPSININPCKNHQGKLLISVTCLNVTFGFHLFYHWSCVVCNKQWVCMHSALSLSFSLPLAPHSFKWIRCSCYHGQSWSDSSVDISCVGNLPIEFLKYLPLLLPQVVARVCTCIIKLCVRVSHCNIALLFLWSLLVWRLNCYFPFKWTVCEKWESPFCLITTFLLFIGQKGGKN